MYDQFYGTRLINVVNAFAIFSSTLKYCGFAVFLNYSMALIENDGKIQLVKFGVYFKFLL